MMMITMIMIMIVITMTMVMIKLISYLTNSGNVSFSSGSMMSGRKVKAVCVVSG